MILPKIKLLKKSLKFYENTDLASQLNTIEEEVVLKENVETKIEEKIDSEPVVTRSDSLTLQDFRKNLQNFLVNAQEM